jgi:hypothetical protein
MFWVGNQSVSAQIREDGTYQATGVPVGEAIVVVSSLQPKDQGKREMVAALLEKMDERRRKDLEEKERKEQFIRDHWVAIPERYSDKQTTPLKFQITKGETNIFHISIESE